MIFPTSDGQHEENVVGALRPRRGRRRPPHARSDFASSTSRDRAQRRRAARRCLAAVLVAARRGPQRRRGPDPRFFLCAAAPPFAAPPASHLPRSCWYELVHLGFRRLWLGICCCVTKDDSSAGPQLCAWRTYRSTVHVRDARAHQDERVVIDRARPDAASCEHRHARRDHVVRV